MKKSYFIFALAVIAEIVYVILLTVGVQIASMGQIITNNYILYAFCIFLWLISIILIIKILLKPDYAYNKSHWILILIASPFVGILLYFIFARDYAVWKLVKKRPLIANEVFLGLEENTFPDYQKYKHGEIFKFIKHTTGRSVYEDDTHLEVLNNGDVFFPRLIDELKNAKEYIFMEFYIIKNDDIGTKVLDVLREKAETGVDVYLIYDHYGSNKHLDNKYMKSLVKAGVKIGAFDPAHLSIWNSNLNFRNHRKATVIDGKVGFVGGMNLGDEYNHNNKKFGFWRDTHIVLKGNGVTSIQNVFVKDWYHITNNVIEKPMNKSIESFPGFVSIIESGPDFENRKIRDVYFKMINNAKKSIKIVTPYLIIESELMLAIKTARNSGVQVDLLVPGKHDYKAVGYATESYYDQLLRIGVKIHIYRKHFVHSKILIVDDEIASVGSVNFDPRSFHLNFEVTSIFENKAVDDLVKSFNEDLTVSDEVIFEEWKRRSIATKIIQGLINLFSPVL